MLAVRELMVFYENALAVNNVSLEVPEGGVVVLLGSNGAGKSTLMATLSGIMLDRIRREKRRGGERITVLGTVEYRGEEVSDLEARDRVRRGIVLCPERRRVFPESSVLENLKIGGHLASRRERRSTLESVWELFPELHDLRGRAAGFLSGGEQQMLALGRALMAKPRLFLVDEPLLGLAPPLQGRVVKAIGQVAEQGVTVLMAEQYARPILPVVRRGYVIESGSIVFSGSAEELMANPHVRAAYFGG